MPEQNHTSTTTYRLPFWSQQTEKRKPTVETCVKGGDFLRNQALSSKYTPLEKEQMLERARKAYQQGLDIDPGNAKALSGLAAVYMHLKDYHRALATYEQGLKLHPQDGGLWFDLAMCRGRLKQFDHAITAFRNACRLEPDNRIYATNLGYCLARAGRIPEAVQVLASLHGKAQAHYKVAWMMVHVKQPRLAVQHLQLALQTDPDLDAARQMLVTLTQNAPPAGAVTQTPNAPGGIVNTGYQERPLPPQ